MSNETKKDVFDEVRRVALQDETLLRTANIHVLLEQDEEWHSRYDAALPDDLPVIPEAVDKYIRWCKGKGGVGNVSDAIHYTYGDVAAWIYDERKSDTFASAWLLGVWRVEETGEIVKLEAEK